MLVIGLATTRCFSMREILSALTQTVSPAPVELRLVALASVRRQRSWNVDRPRVLPVNDNLTPGCRV
jgi:hypothetical protein